MMSKGVSLNTHLSKTKGMNTILKVLYTKQVRSIKGNIHS